MEDKVYVVVCDYDTNGGNGVDIHVFSTFDKAQAFMNRDYESLKEEIGCDEYELTENFACMWKEGEYSDHHIAWEIYEQKVL